MNNKKLRDLVTDTYGIETTLSDLTNCGINDFLAKVARDEISLEDRARINIIALGDVGTNLLMGLRLTGGDIIGEIGLYDLNEAQVKRLEMEFNQMSYPPLSIFDEGGHKTAHCIREMPRVKIITTDDELLDCDVLVFCATKSIPEIGASGDVRMAQLEANLGLVKFFGEKIKAGSFNGLVAVVSDPVDQLCKGMLDASGLNPGQVRGFGLGVMAARARYYAEKRSAELREDGNKELAEKYETYLREGRGYGPHGQDLVIANSIEHYDEDVSMDLTKLTVEANLRVRDLGFKPFLAPAISSAAFSIILTLRGEWNYGSLFFGNESGEGAYVGVLSRLTEKGVQYEERELPKVLYNRIEKAYRNLL